MSSSFWVRNRFSLWGQTFSANTEN